MAGGSHARRRSKKPIPPPSPMAKLPSSSSSSSRRFFGGGCSFRTAVLAVIVIFVLSVAWRGISRSNDPGPAPEFYTFEVVNEYDHDPRAFTQGLLYAGNNTLFESTGLYKESSVRKVLLQTGKVEALYEMSGSLFGEGLTLVDDRLYQLTWLTRTGYIYDRHNLKQVGSFTHHMQDGWGLATDGKILFGSDGTSSLYEINPQNFKVTKRVTVRYNDREVPYINELEYINGEVWANVWQTDCIARISHKDGKVLSWVLLHQLRQHLLASGYTGIDVLNGIAWDEDEKRLFVTGKLWPKLYEIKLNPVAGASNWHIKDLCPLR